MKPTEIVISLIIIDVFLVGAAIISGKMSDWLRMKSSRYDSYRNMYDAKYEDRGMPVTPMGILDSILYWIVKKQLQLGKKVSK